MDSREDRIERYYDGYSAWDLAELLVDAEDEIESWKRQVIDAKVESDLRG